MVQVRTFTGSSLTLRAASGCRSEPEPASAGPEGIRGEQVPRPLEASRGTAGRVLRAMNIYGDLRRKLAYSRPEAGGAYSVPSAEYSVHNRFAAQREHLWQEAIVTRGFDSLADQRKEGGSAGRFLCDEHLRHGAGCGIGRARRPVGTAHPTVPANEGRIWRREFVRG